MAFCVSRRTIPLFGIEYILLKPGGKLGPIKLHGAIMEGKCSIRGERMNGGLLDGTCPYAIVVYVPASVIVPLTCERPAWSHVSIFTAFAEDDRVIHYQTWRPEDAGDAATIVTFKTPPKRLKTVISTKFAHRG